MAATNWKSPTIVTQSTESQLAWSLGSPLPCGLSSSQSAQSNMLLLTGFDLGVPTGETPAGIELRFTGQRTAGLELSYWSPPVLIVNGEQSQLTSFLENTYLDSNPEEKVAGGASDTWGGSLPSVAELNAADFGVAMSAFLGVECDQTIEASLSALEMRVHY